MKTLIAELKAHRKQFLATFLLASVFLLSQVFLDTWPSIEISRGMKHGIQIGMTLSAYSFIFILLGLVYCVGKGFKFLSKEYSLMWFFFLVQMIVLHLSAWFIIQPDDVEDFYGLFIFGFIGYLPGIEILLLVFRKKILGSWEKAYVQFFGMHLSIICGLFVSLLLNKLLYAAIIAYYLN